MLKTLAKKYKQNCKLCGTSQSFIAAPIKFSPSQKNVPKSNYLPIYFSVFPVNICHMVVLPELNITQIVTWV